MLEPRARRVDWANLEMYSTTRRYDRAGTRRKYDVHATYTHVRAAPARPARMLPSGNPIIV